MSSGTEDALEQFIDPLRALRNGIRWVSRTNYHLTLRFLGNQTPVSQLETLAADFAVIVGETQPFSLSVQGIGGFPSLMRPRVIWAGLHSDGLIKLAADVRAAVSRAGFGDEDHPYTPHLTIARVRDPKGMSEFRSVLQSAGELEFGVSMISSMALYRSVLGSAGANYVELRRWNFGGI
jgi:RNA 2',3'-cyclic 3'-phosphodiesterase